MLKNVSILEKDLPQTPKIEAALKALRLLGEVQNFTEGRFLTDEEIASCILKIDELAFHMFENFPEVTLAQKGHLLFRHFKSFMEEHHFLGFFSEQPIEALHAAVNHQARRLTSRNKEVNLERLVKWNYQYNILNDLQ